MKNLRAIIPVLLVCLAVLVCACGTTAPEPTPTAAPTPAPTATPEPTPSPVPTPMQDSSLPEGPAVVADAVPVETGSVVKNGTVYVDLEAFTAALGLELTLEGDSFTVQWRKGTVSGTLYESALERNGETYELPCQSMLYGDKLHLPLQALCDIMEIGYFEDAEYNTVYCTPGAGSWQLQEGVRCPVLMYHAVSAGWNGDPALNTSPYYFREQLDYLRDNGYTPIFFEDLEHVEDYEKPVILTFDDGYTNNYSTVYPILQEYGFKAVYFVVTSTIDVAWGRLTTEQILELQSSGLVSFQSHTVNHNYLDWKTAEDLDTELRESQLVLTRLTGKQPFVLSYPCGRADTAVVENTALYYRFAVRMTGEMYYTGADPLNIWRIGVYKGLTTERFIEKLERTA